MVSMKNVLADWDLKPEPFGRNMSNNYPTEVKILHQSGIYHKSNHNFFFNYVLNYLIHNSICIN